MTDSDHNSIRKARRVDTDPEWRSILESFSGKIEASPWPEPPTPSPKPEPMYKVERGKDTGFWAVMEETTGGKKDLVVVAAFKKGADEVVKHFEALHREKKNLKHENRWLRYDAE